MGNLRYREVFLVEYKGYSLNARNRQSHLKKVLDEQCFAFSRKEAKQNARRLTKMFTDFKVISFNVVSGGWVGVEEDDSEPEDLPEDLLRNLEI